MGEHGGAARKLQRAATVPSLLLSSHTCRLRTSATCAAPSSREHAGDRERKQGTQPTTFHQCGLISAQAISQFQIFQGMFTTWWGLHQRKMTILRIFFSPPLAVPFWKKILKLAHRMLTKKQRKRETRLQAHAAGIRDFFITWLTQGEQEGYHREVEPGTFTCSGSNGPGGSWANLIYQVSSAVLPGDGIPHEQPTPRDSVPHNQPTVIPQQQ